MPHAADATAAVFDYQISKQVGPVVFHQKNRGPDPLAELPKAVVAHATFQKAVSGDPAEAALAYPVQSLLRVKRRLLTIEAEQNHPVLKKDGQLGRPQQIDFVGVDSRKKWSFALEIKLFNGTKRDRVVRDVVKLLILTKSKEYFDTARYLLLVLPISSKKITGIRFTESGGPIQEVWRRGEKADNFFDVLLPWSVPEKKLWIGGLAPQLQQEFCQALREFNMTSVRGDIKVRRVATDWSDDFASGLWKLGWAGPQKEFYAEEKGSGVSE